MITQSKEELKRVIACDCKAYKQQSAGKYFIKSFLSHPDVYFCRYLVYMRKETHYKYRKGFGSKLKYLYYMRKKNRYGFLLGLEMHGECFGAGVTVRHFGCVTVNSFAEIGENCTLRGDNCIGVSHDGGKPPKIGNNVDIGFGAKVIGDIDIADDVVIGANAVVTKSCLERGAVLAGVPARVIQRGGNHG